MKKRNFLFNLFKKLKTIFLFSIIIPIYICVTISQKTKNEIEQNSYKKNQNYSSSEYFGWNEFNIEQLLNYNDSKKNFSYLNSEDNPFTVFYDGTRSNKKIATHSYWHKQGYTFFPFRWYNYITDRWYGSGINIAQGLEGWSNQKKQEFIGSTARPRGLEYDDGEFANQETSSKINLLDNSLSKLKFYFGVNKNTQNYNNLQFYDFGNSGKDLSHLIFEKLTKWKNEKIDNYQKQNHIIKEFYITNLRIDLNFYITTEQKNYYDYYPSELKTRISKFRFKLNFNYKILYDEFVESKFNLLSKIEKFQDIFKKEFIKTNELTINSDLGSENGLTKIELNNLKDYKNNIDYLDEKIKSFLNSKNTLINKQFLIKYKIIKVNKKDFLDFFIEYNDPINGNKQIIKINEQLIKINYKKTNKFDNLKISERLLIIPGYYLDQTNINSLDIKKDFPKRLKNDKKISINYGGAWLYNSPVKIKFKSTLKEDEILLINGVKIDVLDQNFFVDLSNNLNSNNNEYKIELVKFEKNPNENSEKEVFRWTKVIKILNENLKLNVKWYAWNPEKNLEQRKLIEPYLKINNKEILDKNGEKIPNKDYDPFINIENGVKSELVWVDFSRYKNNTLPKDTRFLQDPYDENNELNFSSKNKKIGFIAEAYIVKKGINLSLNLNIKENNLKIFKLDTNNENISIIEDTENFIINKDGINLNLLFSENEYFSFSGLWLFSYRAENSMNKYKLVYIIDDDNKKLFTNFFTTNYIENFFESFQGEHLLEYLYKKFKIDKINAKNLTYDEIIEYWKLYVSDARFFHFNKEQINIISPIVDVESLNNYTSKINYEQFSPSENDKKTFLKDFENKNFIDYEIEIDEKYKNILKFIFKLNNNSFNVNTKIENDLQYFNVNWKKDRLENYKNLNENLKIRIIPEINDIYLNSIINQSKNKDDFYNLLNNKMFNFEHFDKVSYITEYKKQSLIFSFFVLNEFSDNFYINSNDKFLILNIPDFLNNSLIKKNDIFKNFNSNFLNLNGQSDKNKILLKILEFIKNNLPNEYVYELDYEIENLEDKLEEIVNLLDKNENSIFIKVKTTKNTLKNIKGSKIIEIYNKYNSEIDLKTIVDLSLIKIDDLILEENVEFQNIKNLIEKHINLKINDFKFKLNKEIEIEDFLNTINSLVINPNKLINFKIKGIYENFINEINFNVTYKKETKNFLFDLSNLRLEININCSNFNCIKKKIIEKINLYLNKYLLVYEKDYVIENINNSNELIKLINKKGKNIYKIKVKAINNKKTLNYFFVDVFNNISENENIDVLKKNWLKNEISKKNNNQFNFLWLIPIFIFAFLCITFVSIKLYNKFFRYHYKLNVKKNKK
ncbi:Mbov_0399 family ICE element protein [[Mycoplasma] collis]|uniref:Mbov_0399 family ICE element protein n=1 Tax=[Mycoplasma] collis TaxID=2127 RepID=UPI00051BAE82|nr:hypothetical protein [[Mycoplasma] collis]